MNANARHLHRLAEETRFAHGAGRGYICAPRVRTICDALELQARALDRRQPTWHILAACILSVATGIGLAAIGFMLCL